jgi:hypothetical protein
MRFNVALALSVSILIIGIASWSRFFAPVTVKPTLVAVDRGQVSQDEFAETFQDFLEPATVGMASTTEEDLAVSDVVGRQLFSDYISLKSEGAVTPDNLQALAEKYANAVGTIGSTDRINNSQVTIIKDSSVVLKVYGDAVFQTRQKYQDLARNIAEKTEFSDYFDPRFKNFMMSMAKLCDQAAKELQNMPVPNSLADSHIKLINNYLDTGVVMQALGDLADNPIKAYAAINTQAEKAKEEEAILSNIRQILLSKGILISNS